MTELEREMLLADRADARERERQRRRLLAEAGGADDEEGPAKAAARVSKRRAKAPRSGTDAALQRISAARQRKEARAARLEEEPGASPRAARPLTARRAWAAGAAMPPFWRLKGAAAALHSATRRAPALNASSLSRRRR
jgi:hypothetical protein